MPLKEKRGLTLHSSHVELATAEDVVARVEARSPGELFRKEQNLNNFSAPASFPRFVYLHWLNALVRRPPNRGICLIEKIKSVRVVPACTVRWSSACQ